MSFLTNFIFNLPLLIGYHWNTIDFISMKNNFVEFFPIGFKYPEKYKSAPSSDYDRNHPLVGVYRISNTVFKCMLFYVDFACCIYYQAFSVHIDCTLQKNLSDEFQHVPSYEP